MSSMLNRTRAPVTRALSATNRAAALDTKKDSFAFGLMQGEINAQHMFPFPGAERLSEDQRENLEMMVDPADAVSLRPLAQNYSFSFSPNLLILFTTIKLPTFPKMSCKC